MSSKAYAKRDLVANIVGDVGIFASLLCKIDDAITLISDADFPHTLSISESHDQLTRIRDFAGQIEQQSGDLKRRIDSSLRNP